VGLDDFKFRFPITKHMRFETCNAAHLSDPIIEPLMGDGVLNLVPFK
jgi:hypothetical protein